MFRVCDAWTNTLHHGRVWRRQNFTYECSRWPNLTREKQFAYWDSPGQRHSPPWFKSFRLLRCVCHARRCDFPRFYCKRSFDFRSTTQAQRFSVGARPTYNRAYYQTRSCEMLRHRGGQRFEEDDLWWWTKAYSDRCRTNNQPLRHIFGRAYIWFGQLYGKKRLQNFVRSCPQAR